MVGLIVVGVLLIAAGVMKAGRRNAPLARRLPDSDPRVSAAQARVVQARAEQATATAAYEAARARAKASLHG